METNETCKETVYDRGRTFGSYTCDRKVKGEGLCGIHLGAKRRREKKKREWDEKDRAEATRKARATEFIDRHGLDADPHYDSFSRAYSGKIVISVEALAALLGES